MVLDNITSTCPPQVPTIQRKELMTTNVLSPCPHDVTNGVIEMTSLMTSSGPIDKLHGGTPQRSTFLNLEEAELLRVRCTICLNSNRHVVLGPFQKVKIQTNGVAGWQSCTPTACTRIACAGIRSVTGDLGFSEKQHTTVTS